MENLSKRRGVFKPKDDEHSAESSHTRKPRRAKWERLVAIACETISGHRTIEPHGHLEIVLSRIKPQPTPLYEVQRDRSDVGFISDPQARIYYLREQYGFTIENSVDHSVVPARSFYWLVVDESGTRPEMRLVEFTPERNGKTKTEKRQDEPPAPAVPTSTDARGQFCMFADAKPVASARGFSDPEMGAAR